MLQMFLSQNIDDVAFYFLPGRLQGAIGSGGCLKVELFPPRAQGKMLSPTEAAFLLQCPYLVNCSELAAPGTTESRRKGAPAPKKPQRKCQICPRPRHSTHGLPQQASHSIVEQSEGSLSKYITATCTANQIEMKPGCGHAVRRAFWEKSPQKKQ